MFSGSHSLNPCFSANLTSSVMSLTRQNVPQLPGTSVEQALKGGYVLADSKDGAPELIIVATGSETDLALKAQDKALDFPPSPPHVLALVLTASLPC